RLRKPVRVEQRRALAIERFRLRIWPDQPIEIARLELVRVAHKRRDIADAVVARPALEEVMEHERGKRRISARAAAGDDRALLIDEPLPGKKPHTVDAVLDVDDTPRAEEPFAIVASETGAAAIVHVEHCDAAAGPELVAQRERARRAAGWPAVHLHDKRRPLAGARFEVRIVRGIEQTERGLAAA